MAARLGTTKPKPAGNAGSGRALDTADNRRAIEEAEQAQFLSAIFKVRSKDVEIGRAKAVVDALNAERKEVMDLAVAAGFKKYEIEDQLKDLVAPKVNQSEKEARRARFRAWLGLPAGAPPQTELPLEVRDEQDWEADGYRAGIRADEPKPPKECPPRFGQAWMKGYHAGQEQNAKALAFKPASVIAAAPPPAPAPEPEKEPTRAELKAQEKRVREGLENLGQRRGDEFVDDDQLGVNGAGVEEESV